MQRKTDPPRDHLTAEQVEELLTGQSVTRGFGCELLDSDNRVVEDISADCKGFTVSRDNTAEVHGSIRIDLARELPWGRARIRPYRTLSKEVTERQTVSVIDRPELTATQSTATTAGWNAGDGVSVDGSTGALQLASTVTPEYPGDVMALSPLRYYRFAEGGGSVAADETGAANGTYVSGAAGTSPVPGGAGRDGGYVTVPNWTQPQALTINCWFKCEPGELDDAIHYYELWGFGPNNWDARFNTRRSVTFHAYAADGSWYNWSLATGFDMDDGQWHMLTLVWDGINGAWASYLDGVQNSGQAFPPQMPSANGGAFYWGGTAGQRTWAGEFAEGAVFDTALSSAQVAALYAGVGEASMEYATSGTWTSPPLDLSSFAAITDSSVDWSASVPASDGLVVETSVDGGESWQAVAGGAEIAGATAGGSALVRLGLTGDGATTPTINSITLRASRSEVSHPEIRNVRVPLTARFYRGVYVLTTPDTNRSRLPIIFGVSGQDLLQLLTREVGETYVVTAGTTYMQALRDLLTAAGITTTPLLDGTRQDTTLPETRVWALTAAPRWIDVANDLLAEIGYLDLWFDENGTPRSEPVAPIEDRAVEKRFDTSDQLTDIMGADRSEEYDAWSAPNTWRFVRNRLAYQPFEGDGLYSVVNQSDGDSSIDSIGVVSVTHYLEVADQAALVAEGNRIIAADRRAERKFTFRVDPFPIAFHRDVVELVDAGRVSKVQVTSWDEPTTGRGTWVLGGGPGGASPARVEQQATATVTSGSATGLRVVVDGAEVDSPAVALKVEDTATGTKVDPTYVVGQRVSITVRNPVVPLVNGIETSI